MLRRSKITYHNLRRPILGQLDTCREIVIKPNVLTFLTGSGRHKFSRIGFCFCAYHKTECLVIPGVPALCRAQQPQFHTPSLNGAGELRAAHNSTSSPVSAYVHSALARAVAQRLGLSGPPARCAYLASHACHRRPHSSTAVPS